MVLWPFLSCGFSIKYIHSFIQGNEGSTGEEERSRRLVLRGKKRKQQQQPTTTVLRPLYRSVCVSRHLQLRTGRGFCWCKVLLPRALADGNQRIRITQKTLEFSSTISWPRMCGKRAPRRTCRDAGLTPVCLSALDYRS